MISETMFATHSASFWKTCTPTSEAFIRVINSHLLSRRIAGITSVSERDRRGLINETAFEAFVQRHFNKSSMPPTGKRVSDKAIKAAFHTARTLLSRTEAQPSLQANPPSKKEIEDIQSLVANLERRFWTFLSDGALLFRPQFRGCGILSACTGDLMTLDCLFEVKAGDRLFCSIDIRQIIIYSALLYKEKGYYFKNIELFNPRSGSAFTCELDFLCFEISGKSTS